MANRFSVEAIFKAVDRVSAPVSRMQNRVGKFTRSAEKSFRKLNKQVGKFGAGMKKAAVAAVAGAALIGKAIVDVTKAGAEFGRAIGSAAAKFPDDIKRGSAEFKALEKAARDVGSATEFTATQAAQGLGFLAKAGFDAKFSMAALAPIVDFATASELDLATAADIASDAIGSFGLNTDDPIQRLTNLNRVMDVMSKTANSTNTSVEELFEAVRDGAPIASAAGVSIETFSSTMGFLASNGIKAGKAGTAAKNITLALAGVGNKAAVTFKRLGVSLQDSEGNLRDQFDVMDDLRNQLKGMGSLERVNVLSAIFGKIPLAAATKLLESSGQEVRGLRKELEAAGGSSKRTAEFIRNDVKGSLDGLNSAIDGVKISIFALNEGPMKDAIDKMTDWVRANEAAIASGIGGFFLMLINNMENIVKWTKRIGIAVGVFIAFATVLKTLIGVLTLVNLVMAANPITLIVLAVLAGIAAFTALVVWIDEVAAGFDRLPKIIQFILGPIGLLIKAIKFVKDNAGAIGDIGARVGSAFGFGGDDAAPATQGSPSERSQTSSPQERALHSVEEKRTTSSSELTIKDETNRATVTSGKLGSGVTLVPSGAF